MGVSLELTLTPASIRRAIESAREGVTNAEIARSLGCSPSAIGRLIAEHAPDARPRRRGSRAPRPTLTPAQRAHLARLERGPAPLVSDPTRHAVMMPGTLLNRATVAVLAERGLVSVSSARPRVASITDAGRAALAEVRP